MTFLSTQEMNPQGMFASCWNQAMKMTNLTHAAIIEVMFGEKAEEALTDLRERTANVLFH